MNPSYPRSDDERPEDHTGLASTSQRSQPVRVRPVEQASVSSPGWWTQLLDGDRPWGSMEVSPARYGVTRYRLVVFPPGIDRLERRLLRAWRAWPTWGLLLWLLSLCLCSSLTPWARIAFPTVVWLASGAYLFARVGPLRTRVRTLYTTRVAGYPDLQSLLMYAKITTAGAALRAADAQREQGLLPMAAYEAAWWQVYDQLGPDQAKEEVR